MYIGSHNQYAYALTTIYIFVRRALWDNKLLLSHKALTTNMRMARNLSLMMGIFNPPVH